jgi:quercetin dioxygenase-like cupin family protein
MRDRHRPLKSYCKVRLLPGERKRTEPMAARLAPDEVRRMHRSLHHLVAAAPGSDDELPAEVRRLGSMVVTSDKISNLTGTTPNGRLGLNSFRQEHVSWSLTHEGGDVTHSRRELAGLFTAFAAAGSAHAATLPSRTYRFEDMPVRKGATAVSRAILQGQTRTGYGIEIHQTELPPGQAPHPPHRHLHEEMVMVREGTLEVTISGKAVTLGPGSVAYVASNEEHGWRNVGTSQASYFVLTLGRDL